MTIISTDDTKVPPSSPPTYAEVAASMPRPTQSATQASEPANPSHAAELPPHVYHQPLPQPMPAPPPQRAYGPTPLLAAPQQSQTTTALPYYDPRSPWAMQAAAARARRRFFGALFWGCVIWLAVGSLVGGAVDDARRRRGGGGSWAVE
jgi:hypothetical protein